jgi:hypothetical protein
MANGLSEARPTRARPTVVAGIVGGLVGPLGFIGAWSILGATRRGYSPVHDAISRLAAIDASTRGPMTLGFVAFGVGLPLCALALREELPGPTWMTAGATGLATLGVAAVPLDASSTGDVVHGAFASVGYATLAATPWLAARSLDQAGRPGLARLSRLAAAVSGASLAATVVGPFHGLFQRLGLTVGDVWIMAAAVAMARRSRMRGPVRMREPVRDA